MVPNLTEVSFGDQHFLKLLDKSSRLLNGHWQVPLPFKNPDVCFPNNKVQVIKSLKYLERNFEHYKIFIEDLMKKGLFKRVQTNI